MVATRTPLHSGKGKNVSGRLSLKSLHMGQGGKNKDILFAQKISVGEYARQAVPMLNQMIADSQKILRVSMSKV